MTTREKKERRYVVTAVDPAILKEAEGAPQVELGYWDSPDTDVRMVRRTLQGFEIIRRLGAGVVRAEEKVAVTDASVADFLLRSCPHRLRKRRLLKDGWKLDVYDGALEGLVIAEIEVDDASAAPASPAWMRGRVDVTDRVTNLHLARLAGDLERSGDASLPRASLHARVPRVVLTGGPCSGKSTLIESLSKSHAALLHCVPETATIVIAQVGVRPPVGRPLEYYGFQRAIAGIQRHFEEASADQARRDGKRALLLDRGIPDSAAYLPGGLDELVRMTRTTVAYEYGQYDMVICLETPPRDVYEAKKSGNAARSETYDQAAALGARITSAWSGHPGYVFVPNLSGWDEKRAAAVSALERFLERIA